MTNMKKQEKSGEGAGTFSQAFRDVLAHVPDRSRAIIAKRFGVVGRAPMTLQAIGDAYDITRERVRQIVQSGVRTARDRAEDDAVAAARTILTECLRAHHGIATEETIVADCNGDDPKENGAIRFFIESSADVDVVSAKKFPVKSRVIMLHDFDLARWNDIHATVKKVLVERRATCTGHDLHRTVVATHGSLSYEEFTAYMAVSREIDKNPFKKWGLTKWDDISPRGVREKAMLVMKEHGAPMHFRDIAKAIDAAGLGKNGRASHPQTVHNELIRDKHFVLVGRGVYAISHADHVPGTVKDVIENVLMNAAEPLSAQDVIDRVLKMRYVKPSTIRVNLNAIAKKMNKKYTLEKNAE